MSRGCRRPDWGSHDRYTATRVGGTGFGQLVASNYNAIVEGARRLTTWGERQLLTEPNPFGVGNTGERSAKSLERRLFGQSIHAVLEPGAETGS